MGIFERFSTMLKSNLNDLISRAENPEKMLNQLILDMKSSLAKAKQETAAAIADEKKLQADAEGLKKQAEDWERRAMLAVQEGRDDLATQALLRYNEALQRIQETMSGMNDKSAFESFDRMAEKIEAIERKALAAAEIQAEFQSDDLMEQFKKLEYKGTADQQLLELKAKMGLLGGGAQDTRQLGAGAKPGAEPVHEAELLENPDKKS